MFLGKFDDAFDTIDRSWNASVKRLVCHIETPILKMSVLVHLEEHQLRLVARNQQLYRNGVLLLMKVEELSQHRDEFVKATVSLL